jgi:hypothetical protein
MRILFLVNGLVCATSALPARTTMPPDELRRMPHVAASSIRLAATDGRLWLLWLLWLLWPTLVQAAS